MSGLYADVLAGLEVDATAPLPAPQVCPVRLDELLAPAPDAAWWPGRSNDLWKITRPLAIQGRADHG